MPNLITRLMQRFKKKDSKNDGQTDSAPMVEPPTGKASKPSSSDSPAANAMPVKPTPVKPAPAPTPPPVKPTPVESAPALTPPPVMAAPSKPPSTNELNSAKEPKYEFSDPAFKQRLDYISDNTMKSALFPPPSDRASLTLEQKMPTSFDNDKKM